MLILDFRTPAEYATGHLPGAILIPTEIPPHTDWNKSLSYARAVLAGKARNYPIAVYCKLGKRSGQAQFHLHQMGYTHVENWGGVQEGLLADQISKGQIRLATVA